MVTCDLGTSKMSLESGTLVVADQGIFCITEFDNLDVSN